MGPQQEIVPYAQPGIRFAVLRGPVHQVRAQARRLERRGRIRILGQGVTYLRAGSVYAAIPYVPLRGGLVKWHRERVVLLAGGVVMALSALATLAAAVWSYRFEIMGTGALIFGAFFLWRLLRHDSGCTGLHCSGCRG